MPFEKVIQCSKVGMTHVIGKGGSTIKRLKADTGANFDTLVKDDGKSAVITITAESDDSLSKAVKEVEQILKEQEDPDYEGPEGSALRAKADAHGKERDRLKSLADEKFNSGDKSAGHEFMEKRKVEDELMRKTSAEAAKAILKYNNSGHGDDYLDLHGLRTAEAEEFVNERLAELEKKTEGTNLHLIPGAGHHSAPGKVALKPMCEELLTKRGIQWTEIDAGSISAKIKGSKGTFAPEGKEETVTETKTKPEVSEAQNNEASSTSENKQENESQKKEESESKIDEKKEKKKKRKFCSLM